MDWNNAILHVINVRSFSSLWYWIVVAIMWSTVSHWVLGVPFDLIQRGRRQGGQAEIDLTDLVRINVNRQLATAALAGIWLIGFVFFVLTMLAALGFIYHIELAQAVLLLVLPLSCVGALTLSTSRLIAATSPQGEALYAILLRHRLWTQVIGMIAIFITGLYGMFYNLAIVRGM
ncbi:component of SufBCD complex [Yoonia sp. MH D7]